MRVYCKLDIDGVSSRDVRLWRSLEKVEQIGAQMGLKTLLIESGKRYYKLAFSKEFIQGRSVTVVAAVCLYTACRVDRKAPFLLIDFSDAVQTSMYQLGQVYM